MTEHQRLVSLARRWLERRRYVVIAEAGAGGQEKPDAIGFKSSEGSALIECKASRADFLADRSKFFRLHPEFGLGMYRYFLCPAGLIVPEEVPDKWGLLWAKGKRVYVKKRPAAFWCPEIVLAEHRLLFSIVRRIASAGLLDVAIPFEAREQRLFSETVRIEREIRKMNMRLIAKQSRVEAEGA